MDDGNVCGVSRLGMISWNSCRVGRRHAPQIVRILSGQLAKNRFRAICLQEIPVWHSLAGHRFRSKDQAFTLFADSASDCGVLLNKQATQLIKAISFRTYSCAVTFGSAILICAHLCQWDEHATLDGICEDVRTSMPKYPDNQFKVFSGMDANVTLPGKLQGIIGAMSSQR